MREGTVLACDKYLKTFFTNKSSSAKEQLCKVYVDESYIHQHYHCYEESIFDPNDDHDIHLTKMPNKGRQYCFAAANQESNLRPTNKKNKKEDQAGLVPDSLWYFCLQQANQKGNYHKAFNSLNFQHWWTTQLLPNRKTSSLNVMDNEK